VRRALISSAAAVLAALPAGCGNERTPLPDVGAIPAPDGFRPARYDAQGVRFSAPANWRLTPGEGTQLATVASGDAQVAIWRYPRTEPLPETHAQLDAARDALVAQIKSRDPTFKIKSMRLIMKPGIRAVQILGVGTNLTNAKARRSMRSVHAYGRGAEVVMDAFAPPDEFRRVDRQTFGPMTRSLKLLEPKGA
jgi:hypothetical protein